MDFLQVFLLKLKEVLPVCLMISISIWLIYFAIRFLNNMFCYYGYSFFSNPFEDIAENIQYIFQKIQDIRRKKFAKNKSIYYDADTFNLIVHDLPDNFISFIIQYRPCDMSFRSFVIKLYNDKYGE